MTDDRTSRALDVLNGAYEEQLFRLAVGSVTADAEGAAFLAAVAAETPEAPAPEALRRFLARADRERKKRKEAGPHEFWRRRKVWSKVATVLLAAVALFALLMLTVSAFRVGVLNLLIKLEPKYMSVQLTDGSDGTADTGLALGWSHAYVPEYAPEGFEVTGVTESDALKTVSYSNKETSAAYLYTEFVLEHTLALDSENADLVRRMTINGGDATLVVKNDVVSLAWVLDSHVFLITGEISVEEAVRIAEHVKFVP